MSNTESAPLVRKSSIREDFVQGNTWLVCQNNDVVLTDYDGPLMPGMYIMFQTKSILELNGGKSYGANRYLMRVEKLEGDSGELSGVIVLCQESTEGDSKGAAAYDDDDEEVVSIPAKGKLQKEVLHLDYPPHRLGIDQVYGRVTSDKTFHHQAFDAKLPSGSPCRIWSKE